MQETQLEWNKTFAPFVLIVDPVTHPQTIKCYKGDTYFSPNFLCAPTSFLSLEDFFLLFFVLCGKTPTLMWDESSERDVRVLKDRVSASFSHSLCSDPWKTDLCNIQLSYFTVFIQMLVIGHRAGRRWTGFPWLRSNSPLFFKHLPFCNSTCILSLFLAERPHTVRRPRRVFLVPFNRSQSLTSS